MLNVSIYGCNGTCHKTLIETKLEQAHTKDFLLGDNWITF